MNPISILHFLAGTWFICSTNFPMWTDGKKTDPQFQYVIVEKRGEKVLIDEVTYSKNNHQRRIYGYDHRDPENDSAFIWRGKGILYPLKSKWEVALQDPNGQWAVIHFSKTLFTPEGVDIIFRTRTPDTTLLTDIKRQMEQIPTLQKHVSQLVTIR